MIKVWNRRDNWETIGSIEAFCLTICRNLSLDRLRKQDNQNYSLDADATIQQPDGTANPYETTSQRDRVELIRQLIDALPEKQRSCIQLRDFEGKAYKEIAEVLEISEEQVKVNIFRARQAIKTKFKQLDDYGL